MHTACVLYVFLGACVWFRDVTSFYDASGYGLRSSKSESEQWVWCVNIETGSYSNADHTRRIRKGRDVTKSDACAQKTHRTHAACIQLWVEYSVLTMQLPQHSTCETKCNFPYTILPAPHERKQLNESKKIHIQAKFNHKFHPDTETSRLRITN